MRAGPSYFATTGHTAATLGLMAVTLSAWPGQPRAAEPPPAPILMTTTATVPPVPSAIEAAAEANTAATPNLPPPRQAALETVGMTPAQEARYRALTKELRCPLCQNQAIADSDAPISADLREQVRARLLAGESDDAIRGFVTDRFGEFALYRPRFGGVTLWLWLAPLALLLVGGAMVLGRLRLGNRRREAMAGLDGTPGPALETSLPTAREHAAAAVDSPDADHRLARLLAEEGVAPASRPASLTPDPRNPP